MCVYGLMFYGLVLHGLVLYGLRTCHEDTVTPLHGGVPGLVLAVHVSHASLVTDIKPGARYQTTCTGRCVFTTPKVKDSPASAGQKTNQKQPFGGEVLFGLTQKAGRSGHRILTERLVSVLSIRGSFRTPSCRHRLCSPLCVCVCFKDRRSRLLLSCIDVLVLGHTLLSSPSFRLYLPAAPPKHTHTHTHTNPFK